MNSTLISTNGTRRVLEPGSGPQYSQEEVRALLGCDRVVAFDVAPRRGVEMVLLMDQDGIDRGREMNLDASVICLRPVVGPALLCPAEAFR